MKKQSRKQRIEKRQAHADAYKQGFDEGFALGYGTALSQRGEPPDRFESCPHGGAKGYCFHCRVDG